MPYDRSNQPMIRADARGEAGLTTVLRAKRIYRPRECKVSLADRAIRWLWPWSLASYPGMHKGVLRTFSRPYTWQAVRHWMKETYRLPEQAAIELRAAIEARVMPGLVLMDELDAHIAYMRSELKRVPSGLRKRVDE